MNPTHDQQQYQPDVGPPQPPTGQTAVAQAQTNAAMDAAHTTRTPSRGTWVFSAAARDAGRRARGVQWVRPADLLARHSATAAGRGLDLQVELARRTRTTTANGLRAARDRARRLPVLSAFAAQQHGPGHNVAPGAGMSPMGR